MNREGVRRRERGGGGWKAAGGYRTAASSARISDACVAPYIRLMYSHEPYIAAGRHASYLERNTSQIYVPHMSGDRGVPFGGFCVFTYRRPKIFGQEILVNPHRRYVDGPLL